MKYVFLLFTRYSVAPTQTTLRCSPQVRQRGLVAAVQAMRFQLACLAQLVPGTCDLLTMNPAFRLDERSVAVFSKEDRHAHRQHTVYVLSAGYGETSSSK
ncbi:hypothetical protein CEXT_334931 [Caerostris extrusa]|uniref:Secreted protein n=1 Tax=Caerostris extrusa TaxID=172846 RepID=A0AAV4TLG1_CAEEX|nr:hypothetical protein CEXT_334931 [Caerostris extrusa]